MRVRVFEAALCCFMFQGFAARAEDPAKPAADADVIARADRPARAQRANPMAVQEATAPAPAEQKEEPKDEPQVMRDIPERLGATDVQRIVLRHREDLDACVKSFHATADAQGGELVMTWTVLPDGDTEAIGAENADPDNMSLAHCVRDAIDGWYFPQHRAAQRVQFKFKY